MIQMKYQVLLSQKINETMTNVSSAAIKLAFLGLNYSETVFSSTTVTQKILK